MLEILTMLLCQISGGGGVSSICRDTRMYHYFGYFLGGALGFLDIFWLIPGFLGIIFLLNLICFGMIQILGY